MKGIGVLVLIVFVLGIGNKNMMYGFKSVLKICMMFCGFLFECDNLKFVFVICIINYILSIFELFLCLFKLLLKYMIINKRLD